MFCPKCGYQIHEDANFCQKCGTRVHPLQESSGIPVSKNANSELNREALKIHLADVLALECIQNKMQSTFTQTQQNAANLKRNNYLKKYVIYEKLYQDGMPFRKYAYLFYNGASIYLAMEDEYNSKRVCTSDFLPRTCEWVAITDRTVRSTPKWSKLDSYSDKRNYSQGLLHAYEDFKLSAPQMYQKNLSKIDSMTTALNGISAECKKAGELLKKAYQINIIPVQFRNLYAVYYLHEFINTSRESLTTALLHYNLNEIKAKLDRIIEQQQRIIIQQAIIASQNDQLLQQNRIQLQKLSAIENNTSQAAQYAEIAAVNAETCAWISLANYIDHSW